MYICYVYMYYDLRMHIMIKIMYIIWYTLAYQLFLRGRWLSHPSEKYESQLG